MPPWEDSNDGALGPPSTVEPAPVGQGEWRERSARPV
jgi:hypothetical protein